MQFVKILLFGLFFGSCVGDIAAQSNAGFQDVNAWQQKRLEFHASDERDSIFLGFDLTMKRFLASSEGCEMLPDSNLDFFLVNRLDDLTQGVELVYPFMNNIVICAKDEVKTYSWDNLDGGTYHSYNNYLQYQVSDGQCSVIPLDTSETNLEVGYYSIKTIQKGGRKLFVLFGFGTYGSGKQHFAVRIFELKGQLLEECFSCYPEGEMLEIGCNRTQEVDLKYNSKKETISFKEYEFGEGFYEKEFKRRTFSPLEGIWK